MVTKVGKDVFGEEALKNFENEKIRTTYITTHPTESTGTALIAVDNNSENMIVVALGACGKITKEDVQSAEEAFKNADLVLLQLETSMEAIEQTVKMAKSFHKPIILNPAPYQEISDRLLSEITYLTPNETEATQLTGIDVKDEDTARKAAIKLVEKGVKTVIITLGKQGCFVYDGKNEGVLIGGFQVEAVDTTGAGDAFNGGFATYIANGYPLLDAVKHANAVGALAVTKLGTAPAMPYREDVEKLLQNNE